MFGQTSGRRSPKSVKAPSTRAGGRSVVNSKWTVGTCSLNRAGWILTTLSTRASVSRRPIYRWCTADIREGKLGERTDGRSSVATERPGQAAAYGCSPKRFGPLPGRAGLPIDSGPDRDPEAGSGGSDRGSAPPSGARPRTHPNPGGPPAPGAREPGHIRAAPRNVRLRYQPDGPLSPDRGPRGDGRLRRAAGGGAPQRRRSRRHGGTDAGVGDDR